FSRFATSKTGILIKVYSEAALVEKDELSGIKSCFEELHVLRLFSTDFRTRSGDLNFQASEELKGKTDHSFR
ncbi:hypothetical protein, partial [Klebsiella pneumoniae]|uniref:hypothetical protein n=1 Tax=Klebsiella pneumoniae TaxID=573 RepID=UPI0024DE803E